MVSMGPFEWIGNYIGVVLSSHRSHWRHVTFSDISGFLSVSAICQFAWGFPDLRVSAHIRGFSLELFHRSHLLFRGIQEWNLPPVLHAYYIHKYNKVDMKVRNLLVE